MVVWLFLAVPYVCLRFVIVVFPDHTHLLFIINYQCDLWILALILLDFSLTVNMVKAATLIFISGRCSAISSAKQGKSGSIYNLVKNQ